MLVTGVQRCSEFDWASRQRRTTEVCFWWWTTAWRSDLTSTLGTGMVLSFLLPMNAHERSMKDVWKTSLSIARIQKSFRIVIATTGHSFCGDYWSRWACYTAPGSMQNESWPRTWATDHLWTLLGYHHKENMRQLLPTMCKSHECTASIFLILFAYMHI